MHSTYFIVAEDRESALRRAYAVEAKRLPFLPHYASHEAAQAWADEINGILHARLARVFPIHIHQTTTDDGRIPVARVVERACELASALLILVGGCWAVGWSTLL